MTSVKSELLKTSTWNLAFEPLVREQPLFNWGLGFNIFGSGNVKVLNNNGRTTGFKGGFYQDLKDVLHLLY